MRAFAIIAATHMLETGILYWYIELTPKKKGELATSSKHREDQVDDYLNKTAARVCENR